MTFESQRGQAFCRKKYKLLKKRNGIENRKFHTQFQRDEPCASLHIKTAKTEVWEAWARERKKIALFVPFI